MKIILTLALFAAHAAAQLVTVAGNVTDAAGGSSVGTVTVSWPNFNYAGTPVPAGSSTKRPSSGAVSFTLYPGTYTVTYRLVNGSVTTAKWVVPASPTTTTIAAVQTTFNAPLLPAPLPVALGGTGRQSGWTADKCVKVNSDGDALEPATDGCGTASIPAAVQSGTSYTVVAADKGTAIFFTSASTVTVTIPAASAITGSVILVAKGAGAVNLSGGFTLSMFQGDYVLLVSDGTTWRNVNQILRAGNGQQGSLSGAVTTLNLDALLYAIDQLAGNGFIAQTGATTVANRTITGTANEVCLTNGDGVSGNPTAAICATFDISGKTSTKPMKVGTSPPGTCGVGDLFFDSDALAGANILGCTAPNVWSTLSGGGGDALTSNPLSQFAATTSAQLAGTISNETGSSLLVFNTNPTLVTPLIQNYTVAGLPSAGTAGRIAIISDSSDGTCTSGGGSTWVFCRDTGSAWAAIAGGGGGTTYTAGTGITISGTTINADDANGKLPMANDGSTGTTLYYAVVADSSNNAVKAATTDTSKILGVCGSGCGTSGTATIVQRGEATLHSEGAVTLNQYVVISTSTAGAFASTATCPTDKQVLGLWSETQGSAGDWTAKLQPGLCVPASSGGGIDVTETQRKWFDYCSEGAGDIGLHFVAANSGGISQAHYAPSSNARAGCGQTITQTGATSGNYAYVETANARKWLIVNEKNTSKLVGTMTAGTDSGQDLGFIWNSSSGADFTDTHDRIEFTQASSTSGGYSGYANTTAWHVGVCSSAACAKTNTAVTVTAGRTYRFTFLVTGATTATWTIRAWTNDGSVTETTGNLTGLTWFTSPVQPYAVVINRNGTANHSFTVHSGVMEWAQ